MPTAVPAGYDWGGRAACVAATLWPERRAGRGGTTAQHKMAGRKDGKAAAKKH